MRSPVILTEAAVDKIVDDDCQRTFDEQPPASHDYYRTIYRVFAAGFHRGLVTGGELVHAVGKQCRSERN